VVRLVRKKTLYGTKGITAHQNMSPTVMTDVEKHSVCCIKMGCVLCPCVLYSSPNIVRVIKSGKMRWAGHVACMGEGTGVYRVLVGRPKEKRPLSRPRHRWEDNIKMDLREIGINGANWIWLDQDRVQWQAFVSTVMNLWVP
jgi:hypothetical protein